jgi:sorbose reductase
MASSAPNGVVSSQDEPSRSSLVNRQLPEMRVSTGDETSMTAPPPPIPRYLDGTGRALYRFAVEGNAVSMS